jgi:cytochrome c biogenesis protein
MFKKTVEFLGSIRLVLFILIVLTIASLIGVIIPQDLPSHQYEHAWGVSGGKVLFSLGLNHVFSSLWFYALLGFLSLNIFMCAISKLWKNIRNILDFHFLPSPKELPANHQSFTLSGYDPLAVANKIKQTLRYHFYITSVQSENGNIQIAAKTGMLKQIGSIIFHLSILILFAGGLIGKMGGYSYIAQLSNGQVISVKERPFLLRSDWFKLEKNPDGSVKDYKTKLALLNPDSSLIREKIIEVNSPLSYQGIRFYQSSFGEEPSQNGLLNIKGPLLDSAGYEMELPEGEGVLIPQTGITVRISGYLPDFVIDMKSGSAYSRSDAPNNPAYKVLLLRGIDTVYHSWVFVKYPDMHMAKSDYKVSLTGNSSQYYTGIQIRNNPGVPLIWTGIILMTFGIISIFYVSKKFIWIFIRQNENQTCTVSLGGTTERSREGLAGEINKISRVLEQHLNKGRNT